MKRAEWIDSCRFLAIFVIMATHFLAAVYPEALTLWEEPPCSYLLYGLTGKFSVAFFFVFLGYFASKPAVFKVKSMTSYLLKRYFQFSFYIFSCTGVYICGCYCLTWLLHCPDASAFRVISDGFYYNFIYLLRDAFLFEDNYNATLWCMQQLFLASLICKALGYLPQRLSPLFRILIPAGLITLLMLIDPAFNVWICAAILGHLLRLVLESNSNNYLHRPVFTVLLLLIALLCIKFKMPESPLQYSLQSIAATILIYVQFGMPSIQKLLSHAPLPWLGSISIGLFVLHTPVNSLLFSSLYPLLLRLMPTAPAALICFACSTLLCIGCAWILNRIYNSLIVVFSRKKVYI